MANTHTAIRSLGRRERAASLLAKRAVHHFVRAVLPTHFYQKAQALRLRRQYPVPFRRLFRQVAIETRTDCNLRCEFCPQSSNPRPQQVMSQEMFKKIIDDLAAIDYSGRIMPFANNEPLLDDRLVGFVAYARKQCPLSELHLLTNGVGLSVDTVKELLAAGIDDLVINDYRKDRAKNPFRVSGNLAPIAELSQEMLQKKVRISFRSSVGILTNRAGSCKGHKTRLPLSQLCIRPFYQMIIQPNGEVVLCCQDYTYEENMGDARTTSVADIWFNERFSRIRAELYNGDRTGKICERCDFNGLS